MEDTFDYTEKELQVISARNYEAMVRHQIQMRKKTDDIAQMFRDILPAAVADVTLLTWEL